MADRRTRLVEQAEVALARLADDPRDHVARGSLHEAAGQLDDRVVGEVALVFRSPTVAQLSWVVHPDVQGRGLATEATTALLDLGFGHYACHRIFAELDPRNTASMRLCERLGMRRESHRLSDFWSTGEWTDTYEYALLASEWAEHKH